MRPGHRVSSSVRSHPGCCWSGFFLHAIPHCCDALPYGLSIKPTSLGNRCCSTIRNGCFRARYPTANREEKIAKIWEQKTPAQSHAVAFLLFAGASDACATEPKCAPASHGTKDSAVKSSRCGRTADLQRKSAVCGIPCGNLNQGQKRWQMAIHPEIRLYSRVNR